MFSIALVESAGTSDTAIFVAAHKKCGEAFGIGGTQREHAQRYKLSLQLLSVVLRMSSRAG